MVGRVTEATIDRWAAEFNKAGGRIARHFPRVEVKRRAAAFVRTFLSDVERKNGWQTAERLGESGPSAVQHLLGRSRWDPDALRGELAGYVRETLGDPTGVLVVDETGFLKKGKHSVGVARQYSGAAGRIENCQIGVFLGYASPKGHALVDRELYLPKEWAGDAARQKAVGVPKGVEFATKITLARRMVERAVAAGLPAKWATADAVYGADYRFRLTLEELGLGYVVAVPSDFAVWVAFQQVRAKHLLAKIPAEAWQRQSCGAGSKGPRVYDWALMRMNAPEPKRQARWLLVRRSVADPGEAAFFACGGPPKSTFEELVAVAGRRWAVEECFETVGAGRRQRGALESGASARPPPRPADAGAEKGGARMVRLSVPDVRRLLIDVAWARTADVGFTLAWSRGRRHQYVAKVAHYRRRAARPPDDEVQL